MSFILVHQAIRTFLNLEDPFTTHKLTVWRRWNQRPSVIRAKSLKFKSIVARHSLMERASKIEWGLERGGVGAQVDK